MDGEGDVLIWGGGKEREMFYYGVDGEGDVLIWGRREFRSAAAVGVKENLVAEVQDK